jgi:sec-independent protein translocase protein TatC
MAKKPTDDLFEKSTMTFGEHLEELRVCLFRSVIGIAVGCIIGFAIANQVVRFFQSPLETAMEQYYLSNALEDVDKQYGELTYEAKRMILDEKLVPEAQLVDVGRLAQALKLDYPESLGGLEISPYWFTPGDLLPGGARTLCRDLVAGKDESDTARGKCWQLLDQEQRQAIQAIGESSPEFKSEEVGKVLQVLNALAGDRSLHESKELSSLAGRDTNVAAAVTGQVTRLFSSKAAQTSDMVAQIRDDLAKQFDAGKSRRLNKLLLARVFPDALHTARINALQVFTWRPVKVRFQSLDATEPFMIWMKAGMMTGLVLASPYVFYQIWIFVAAGLYPHEKHYVFLYLPISLLLFFGGASLAFAFVFQPVLSFLFTFNKGMNAEFDPRIGEWLNFVLILPLGFGISFQLPLVMLFINRIGIASLDFYVQQWRVAILIICVISMVLTPADPVSMLLMAVPLCFLYLLGIGMCKYMPSGKSPFAEAYEP